MMVLFAMDTILYTFSSEEIYLISQMINGFWCVPEAEETLD